jgi:chromosome partitioning protein
MRTISLVNQKGGVGKTTCTVNIGAALSRLGKKVLLVDLDPQSSMTIALGAKGASPTVYDVLRGATTVADALLVHGKYVLLPSEIGLSAAELELAPVAGRECVLREALEAAGIGPQAPTVTPAPCTLKPASKHNESYDYVLIDCPPSLSLLTLNALVATDEVFVALQTEYLALEGMTQLLGTIDLVKKRLNPKLSVAGIIATQFDSRKGLHREVVETIHQAFPELLFKTFIRNNIALAEATSFGLDIFEYRPRCNGAEDFAALAEEILAQER